MDTPGTLTPIQAMKVKLKSQLDHIVVVANSLEEGKFFIRELMNVEIPAGGRHQMMGTHNCVMALGPSVYLEVIAIDPDMKSPQFPRWFGLDDPHVLNSLHQGPRLLTWAVNTMDIDRLVRESKIPAGEIREAQRGDLKWKVALREDGGMPAAGFLPLCIQWQIDFHPAQRMIDFGWRMESLRLFHHRNEWLEFALDSIGALGEVEVISIPEHCPPYMEALLKGPHGSVIISSQKIPAIN